MRRYLFTILVFLLFPFSVFGAEDSSQDSLKRTLPFYVSGSYHHGFVLSQHRSIPYYIQDPINGIEVGATRYFPQINPNKPPEIGFGYYLSNLSNREIYGRTHGLFAILGTNYFKGHLPFYLHQIFSFGVSYNTEHFDIEQNPSNRVIGSSVNAFLTYSLHLTAEIGDNLIISAGPAFVHMSNGNIKHPNYGLNLVNTRLGMSYKLGGKNGKASKNIYETEDFAKNRYMILFSAGSRQVSRKIPESYLVGSLLTEYSRRVSTNYAFGIGADLIFDRVEGMETYISGSSIEEFVPWHLGLHLTWERIWNRFSLSAQPGIKMLTFSDQRTYQYNRLSMRYRPVKNIVLKCAIKANGIRADFIDFGVGYNFER